MTICVASSLYRLSESFAIIADDFMYSFITLVKLVYVEKYHKEPINLDCILCINVRFLIQYLQYCIAFLLYKNVSRSGQICFVTF